MKLIPLLCLVLVSTVACTTNEVDDATESELGSGIAIGTYVAERGPSGSLPSSYDRQTHIMRLTVTSSNRYEADVLVEQASAVVNPFFPWLTSRSIATETVTRRGTMRATRWKDAPAIKFGDDVGTFNVTKSGRDLDFTSTAYRGERTTTLRRDDAYVPPRAQNFEFDCVHRNIDRGTKIQVRLDRDNGRSGTAVVTAPPGDSQVPKAGSFSMTLRETYNGWRRFELTSGTRVFTMRFPERDLDAKRGAFDGAGDYPIDEDIPSSGDYAFSLRCTFR
jgi:hypothetical protein